MLEVKNAKIESTMLGYEDHGIMTAMLHLSYSGSSQGFGGYQLDEYVKGNWTWNEDDRRGPHKACGWFIQRVLETVGVEKWEELKGKYIRVEADWGKVHKIGHLLEDKWFNPAEELKTLVDDKD